MEATSRTIQAKENYSGSRNGTYHEQIYKGEISVRYKIILAAAVFIVAVLLRELKNMEE